MRLVFLDADNFDDSYFKLTGELKVDFLRISDLPRCEVLLNLPLWQVKSYADRVFFSQPYEGQFLDLWERTRDGHSICRVLRCGHGKVYGAAWTSPDELGFFCRRLRILDLAVHPRAVDHGVSLVQEVVDADASLLIVSYAAREDTIRKQCLREVGFRKETTIPDRIEVEGVRLALEVWYLRR